MAMLAAARAELSRLRRDIARIEGRLAEEDRLAPAVDGVDAGAPAGKAGLAGKSPGRLSLGIPSLDRLAADPPLGDGRIETA